MKQIGIREAQNHLTTLLRDLPFEITRYNKVIATVTFPKGEEKSVDTKEGVKEVDSFRAGRAGYG